jgi:DNA primase
VARTEREALECLLQLPALVPVAEADALPPEAFRVPAHRAVFDAVRAAGGLVTAVTLSAPAWVQAVRLEAPEAVAGLVGELAVAPLPTDREDRLGDYASTVILRMAEIAETSRVGDLKSRLQRLTPDDEGYQQTFADLLAAETRRRSLRERVAGTG